MKNSIFYITAKGRRSLTPFAWSLIGIFAVLIVLAAFSINNAHATQAAVQATPLPLIPATMTPSLPEPTLETAHADGCPTDPSRWDFVDVSPDTNYKRIEPICVYEGLARTVAWQMLIDSYGYDVFEAAHALGFENPSNRKAAAPYYDFASGRLTIRPFQGDKNTSIELLVGDMGPGLHSWTLSPNNEVQADTYMLQGCFQTFDVVGNEKRYIWEVYEKLNFEVICQVSLDYQQNGRFIEDYGENLIISDKFEPGRNLRYFGYSPSVDWWFYFGIANTYAETPAGDLLAKDYALMEEWYGAHVWDDAWLRTFNITPAPLPVGWEGRNTDADFDAFYKKYDELH